ncbi:MAG: hypothetical protein PHX83_08420 [Acidobacteriia bacterium]|nr:hypothetical protein [Terriglobia bacterium]
MGFGVLALLVWGVSLSLIAQETKTGTRSAVEKSAAKGVRHAERQKPKVAKEAPVQAATSKAGRDPFRALTVRAPEEVMGPRLPGKRGLLIRYLQVKGIVRADNERIALVEGPEASGALFLRVNDKVYDGQVVAIRDDGVVFRENSVDLLGKSQSREVIKKITGSQE